MGLFLVVEDSSIVQKILRHTFKQARIDSVLFASSMAEGRALYKKHADQLVAAIVDLSLPDAPHGEMVECLLAEFLPVVVLTGSADADQRKKLLAMGVADYVIKENRFSYQYAVRMLLRLERNQYLTALVVDDSDTSRRVVSHYLHLHCFKVKEVSSAEDGLKALQEDEAISLVISDYHMPGMNGFDFVQEIRHRYDKRSIAVIGLSGQGDPDISVQFIKKGANDFLQKPFLQEEFFCRVTNNIESLEQLLELKTLATKDYLTGLSNRRYFYEEGDASVARSTKASMPYTLAVLDIDRFKPLNDEFGHDAGDAVLRQFSEHLGLAFSRFIVARVGGEEFAVLMAGLEAERAYELLDEFRRFVEAQMYILPDDDYQRITVSIGVRAGVDQSIHASITDADKALYLAKENGRNMVVMYEDEA